MLKYINNLISKLSTKLFLLVLFFIIVPSYLMFLLFRGDFEKYIQSEISGRIIGNVSKSEEEIYSTFKNMANLSNFIVMDEALNKALQSDTISYYDKTIVFDKVIKNMSIANTFADSDALITLFDEQGNLYSNWSTNFNNYEFLRNQDWVQKSMNMNGHVSWSMFTPAFVIEEKNSDEKYISLARAIIDNTSNKRIGTMIVSLRQSDLSKILLKYSTNPNDCIYILTETGEEVFKLDNNKLIPSQELSAVYNKFHGKKSGDGIETFNNKKYLVTYYSISKPWTFNDKEMMFFYFTNYQPISAQITKYFNNINTLMLVFLIFLLVAVAFISIKIVSPVTKLAKHMDNYSINGEIVGLDVNRNDEIGRLNSSFYKMSENIKELFSNVKYEQSVKEEYRFESLRAQLNPHFLFNTLTTIRWMALIKKADNIVDSIDALGSMLKYSMSRGEELVRLEEEISSIRGYVFIENMRYGDMYEFIISLDDKLLKCKVIKFILQPVVENAIIHAFKNKEGKGIIELSGEIENTDIILKVKDNGSGVPEEIIDKINNLHNNGSRDDRKVTGIGMTNVNERIKVAYGERYGIEVQSSEGKGTVVIYRLPLITDGGEENETGYDS